MRLYSACPAYLFLVLHYTCSRSASRLHSCCSCCQTSLLPAASACTTLNTNQKAQHRGKLIHVQTAINKGEVMRRQSWQQVP
jgi:hypothetical protein